jgi:OOP family OmpA-OmpF porin
MVYAPPPLPREETERCRRGLFGALGAWAVIALITLFGTHACSPMRLEEKLQNQVQARLDAANLGAVNVDMDGLRAVLTGNVATAADQDRARTIALTTAGPGGWWAGAVAQVDVEGVTIGPPVSPFTWSAQRDGAALILSGHAPSQAAKQRLVNVARTLYNPVTDNMVVALGAPADADWIGVADNAVRQLNMLTKGRARLSDTTLTIAGEASTNAAGTVREFFQTNLKPPFSAILDITAPGEGLALPELKGIDLANANAPSCQKAFAAIMGSNVIGFETGSATISADSVQLLANLAAVARRCDRFAIEVAGHTDDVGDRAFNVKLSLQRAQAVVSQLIAQGVAPEQLSARGFGSDRPRASNTTELGRAANRRIEFTVN